MKYYVKVKLIFTPEVAACFSVLSVLSGKIKPTKLLRDLR